MGSVVYGTSVTLDAGGNKWTNLADPASAQDAATKAYVDASANSITSGALPTFSPASGTGLQASSSKSLHVVVPITFNPTALLTATCQVDLSPDNSTYTTLLTKTVPALASLAGLVDEVALYVPKGWYVKLTVSSATIGTGHSY